jgi:hypothetical protein
VETSTKRAPLALLTVALIISCKRGEPPTPAIDGAVAALGPAPPSTIAPPSIVPPNSAAAATPPVGQPSAAVVAGSASASASAPLHAGSDIGDQTRDKPAAKSPTLDARAQAVFNAVIQDKPELARSAFFPVAAYEKVKAVGNPAADWRRRLIAAYDRDIRDLHVALGPKAERAKFVGLDVPNERAKWVEPGEEYNKLGYYRVYGTKLRYEVDGRERSFPVKSLISWRGEWYVVHLSGFK